MGAVFAACLLGASFSLGALASGCEKDYLGEPFFPADYRATYTEVRDCRQSGDHDLHRVRVFANPAAVAAYADRSAPFPEGALVMKEEFDFGDFDCEGPIVAWTAMVRQAPDAGTPDMLGWEWQKLDGARTVTSLNDARCWACHTRCGIPPDGYLGTCTVP